MKALVLSADPEVVGAARVLVSRGYELLVAPRLGEASLALERGPVCLILVDRRLPDADAPQACSELREGLHGRAATLVAIVDAAPGAIESALSAGADDFHPWSAGGAALSARLLVAGRAASRRSELERAREAVVEAKDAADAATRELESFSHAVAHDLRAPLRSIDGFSEALLEDCAGELDDRGKEYLRLVRESAQQMSERIEALLGLSRVTRSELHREPVDLGEMARAAVARLRSVEPGRDVHAVIEEGLSAEADPRLLAIALDHLLGNAWKFTRRCARAHIEVGSTRVDGSVVFFVRDDGAGFDAAGAGKLFAPFRRLHSKLEFEGTGVGLAIVQRIIRRHGGRVWAEGHLDGGATFYFTLAGKERTEWPARTWTA